MWHLRALKDWEFFWSILLAGFLVCEPYNVIDPHQTMFHGKYVAQDAFLPKDGFHWKPIKFSVILFLCLHKDCFWKQVPELVGLKMPSRSGFVIVLKLKSRLLLKKRYFALLNFLLPHCVFSPCRTTDAQVWNKGCLCVSQINGESHSCLFALKTKMLFVG